MSTEAKDKSADLNGLDRMMAHIKSDIAHAALVNELSDQLCSKLGISRRSSIEDRLTEALHLLEDSSPVADGMVNERHQAFLKSLPAMSKLKPGRYQLYVVPKRN